MRVNLLDRDCKGIRTQGRSQDFVIGGAKRKFGGGQVLKILKF